MSAHVDPTDPAIRIASASVTLERHYFDALSAASRANGVDEPLAVRQLALAAAYARAVALLAQNDASKQMWQKRHDDLAHASWNALELLRAVQP